MKIALIGCGSMGRVVKELAREKGHQIETVFSSSEAGLSAEQLAERLQNAEVAIDFSVAEAVRRNVLACLKARIPLVEGTTGWLHELEDIKNLVQEADGAFVYGANFSIGVNLFYKIIDFTSHLIANFPEYDVFIEERHHKRKKDAPSGTALKIKQIIDANLKRETTVNVTRAGSIPGTHTVGFDSQADTIELTHSARSREGFALGAIFAAEWICNKKGFYEFPQIIESLFETS
ncbi:MAG: hypothetical protein N2Z23_06980 [Pyrinomonadaceae bacterium]|nr:hypothetical protein [Pyrinomonadaceae bacterium]MCX7640167.1 hypothetical protein [Pyrinomonadaceae bacterium]MDW8303245.1 dihydrodipicolinate reductase C-terminal domain-containing protein [Acidobacteriota bacterium]